MKSKAFTIISIIYFVAMICVATIFCLGYMGILKNEFLLTFLIQIVVMFAIPLLMYTIFISKSASKTFNDFGFKKISCKVIIISFAVGVLLYILNSYVATFFASFLRLFGYDNLSKGQAVAVNYPFMIKEIVLSAVLPGIFEEFLHRGMLLNAGKKYANPKFCLIISSILFGLMHLNIIQFGYATILGFLIGYLAIVSKSIFPSMIVHFTNNFLSIYFSYGLYMKWPLTRFINNLENAIFSNIALLLTTCTFVFFGCIYLYRLLTKILWKDSIKSEVKKILKSLNLEGLTPEQAQIKIDQANQIIYKCKHDGALKSDGKKLSFISKIFTISSIVLGGLITISSFIWGIL